MTLINSFSFAQKAISSISSSGSNFVSNPMQSNPFQAAGNPMMSLGSLFPGLDMLTSGNQSDSMFNSITGNNQQNGGNYALAQAGPNGAFAAAGSGAPQQQCQNQQQNPMMQMMGMMMQFMMQMIQMMMQMMGMGQQPQQAQPQQAQNNPMAQAGPGGAAAAAASSPFGSAAAAASSGGAAAAAAASPFGSAAAAANSGGAAAAASSGGASASAFSFVAPNQSQVSSLSDARGAWGDPHYDITVDKNGNGKLDEGERAKFDHKGKDGHTYNVFEGDGLSVKGKYVPHSDPKAPQVIGETEVTAGNDKFSLNKDGKAKLNGQDLNMKDGQSLQLADGTQIKKVNGKEYKVTSKEGDSNINIKAGGNQMEIDPEGKFSGLGGIIGDAMQKVQNGEKMPENNYWEKYDMGVVL